MSILDTLNAGQRRFAEALASGLSYTASAVEAGYSKATAQPASSRMARDPRIQQAVAELRSARHAPPAPPEPLICPWITNPGMGVPAPRGEAPNGPARDASGEIFVMPYADVDPVIDGRTQLQWPPQREAPSIARDKDFNLATGQAFDAVGEALLRLYEKATGKLRN